ncbi:MAG: hypothetical protein ACI4EA_06545 [Candidatus Ornithomonoglobus sp.]
MGFCMASIISVAAANAYGKMKGPKFVAGVLNAHAAFEVLALLNNWVFSVDTKNVYHREGLYWIYIALFALFRAIKDIRQGLAVCWF